VVIDLIEREVQAALCRELPDSRGACKAWCSATADPLIDGRLMDSEMLRQERRASDEVAASVSQILRVTKNEPRELGLPPVHDLSAHLASPTFF